VTGVDDVEEEVEDGRRSLGEDGGDDDDKERKSFS
jgi:hypothetical protein